MPNNWNTYKLGETCNITSSKRIFYDEYVSSGIPFYRSKEIILKSNLSEITNELYISEDKFNEIKNKFGAPLNGDILLTSVGTIGIPYLVKEDDLFYFKDGNLTWLKDFKDTISSNFIVHWIKSNIGKEALNGITIGSTQSAITIQGLKNLELKLPSFQEQQSIASILSAIDDKIENNLAINKTLEEMAMALYKHWFVDFDPFQDGEFIESELGMIPKGWEVKRLDELADIGSSKRIFYDEYVAEGIPFYRGKEVIELSKGKSISSELFISEQKFKEIKSKFDIPTKGDILISSVGTIGVSWLVDGFEEFYFKDGNLTWIKKYKTFLKGEYLHLWLNSENGKNQIDGEVIGSTQKALTISSLRNFKILFPNEEVYKQIGNEFIDYYEQRQLNLIEIKTLTQLRDTLLPQLISGAVRIKEFRE